MEIIAFFAATTVSTYMAKVAVKGATKDLESFNDDLDYQLANSSRQTRQDIASIVFLIIITNGLLAAILVAILRLS